MARSTMADLISELRNMCNAGTADYSVAGVARWTDDQLEAVLDRNRRDEYRVLLAPVETYSGGTVQYLNYYIGRGYVEQGTAMLLDNAAGSAVGTALYSVDYRTGRVAFGTSTGGSVYYWSGRSFDIHRAAADVWRQKAAYYAAQFDFSTDNHSVKRSGIARQCLEMALYYERQATTVRIVDVERGDTC